MTKMTEWMRAASTKEQFELAKRAKTSRQYLYVLSNDRSRNTREAQPGLAARIEKSAEALRLKNPALPVLLRTDLNRDCRNCEYAKACQAAHGVKS